MEKIIKYMKKLKNILNKIHKLKLINFLLSQKFKMINHGIENIDLKTKIQTK